MSVVGIDFGNLSLLIGQTAKGGVDVILNDSSNRQTATAVSIQGKQRFIGDSGAAMARSNITNTISMMKLLVGRRFEDPDVQKELSKAPFKAVKLKSGGVGISILYNDEPMVVSAEHFMAMMLVKAKDISAKANAGLNLADAVLAVPHWYTESQRRGVLNACEIASVNCLKITNESNAIALSYGIFKSAKKLFSETEPTHVMFIDIGYTGYCVTIVDFIQENMKVLATVCDRELGGRDFDDVIIEYMAESFQKKTKIDVRKNIKAVLKLQAAAEKAKKTLSPAGVNEANISVECLAEDTDLAVVLTRDEFESRVATLVARLRAPIEQALSEAKLSKEQLSEVEMLGGTSRINIVKRTLGEILGLDASAMNYGLKTTMNADEAVARGGALQCAMVSSRMKVKPFNIVDKIPYGISVSFLADSGSSSSVGLYSRNDDFPHKPRRLTFHNKTSDFDISAKYSDDNFTPFLLPAGENQDIARFIIKVPSGLPTTNDIRVTWNLDKHGLLYVQSAQLLEEIKDDGTTPPSPAEGGADAKSDTASSTAEGGEATANKKRFKKTDLEVVVEYSLGLTRDEVKEAIELEASMANEDRIIIETADKRNELESYLYAMRDKIDGVLKTYASSAEKDALKKLMNEAEDWLYNDGFDSTKQLYTKKIDELKALSNPIEYRYNETINRPNAISEMKKQLEMCKTFASKYDDNTAHITEDDRDRIRKEIQQAESWMYDMIGKQGEVAAHANPVLTCESISAKRSAIFAVTNPIMNKPKPKPVVETPPPPAPNAETKQPDTSSESKDNNNSSPMDTETSEGKGDDDKKDSK